MTEGECSQLRSLLSQSETIVLCCHQNADGDALGAVLGMGEVLRQMGKEPLMVVPDQYPDYLQWLPNSERPHHLSGLQYVSSYRPDGRGAEGVACQEGAY